MADAAPWVQSLRYQLASAVFHQPLLLRRVAEAARASPTVAALLPVAVSAGAVRDVLERETAFARDGYRPVMFNGDFVIGLEQGPAHARSRACLHSMLPTPAQVATSTVAALDALAPALRQRLSAGGSFDLVEDYMIPLVSSALQPAYGPAFGPLPRTVVEAARWLGAQLLIGSVATPAHLQRAARSDAVLKAHFRSADAALAQAGWAASFPDQDQRLRAAIGVMWVGHPSTTQGGAMVMQELLSRPAVYRRLRADTALQQAGNTAARTRLRDHVLELLRFRPPFPALARAPRRAGLYTAGPERVAAARPGGIFALVLGALHDPEAQREDPDAYAPGRHFHRPIDRQLMFGASGRYCIAQDHVLEILVTALAGLLAMDLRKDPQPLRYASRFWPRRIAYDGPIITRMRLRF